MQDQFRCQNCKKIMPANPRLKGKQSYCSKIECQRARKKQWHQNAMKNDPAYKKQQQECMDHWRISCPQHRYQSDYRKKHPEYVEDNRQKQTIRNQKRRIQAMLKRPQEIVKMDALTNTQSNTYILTPFTIEPNGKIVKMDAFFVQLTQFQPHKPQAQGQSP